MLYLTTRDPHDTFTTARTLAGDTAPNGGLYVPFKLPAVSCQELQRKSFGENIADILNVFFSTRLTGREVEFSIGRYPLKLHSMSQSVLIAQLWRNLDGSYEKMENRLFDKLQGDYTAKVTAWARIAIRIGVLCGVFSELLRENIVDAEHPMDMALPSGDFSITMAAWYGREMGLPIRQIVCCTENNSEVWNLLHLGEMRTGSTNVELERLICGALGVAEACRYSTVSQSNGIYALTPDKTEKLRKGMFCGVVSSERRDQTISNVYHTNAYLLEPEIAGAYSALMDHRAKTGEKRKALLLEDHNPADKAAQIAKAMGLSEAELKKLLEKQ